MLKSSSMGVLLVLSLFLTGSSWSGVLVKRTATAGTQAFSASLPLTAPVRVLPTVVLPTVAVAVSPGGRPAPAPDVWLSVILGGGLVAMQLRRTQMTVRRARVAP